MTEPHDSVRCRVCGENFKTIEQSHLNKHDMTIDEYEEKFPDAERISTETLARLGRMDEFQERLKEIL